MDKGLIWMGAAWSILFYYLASSRTWAAGDVFSYCYVQTMSHLPPVFRIFRRFPIQDALFISKCKVLFCNSCLFLTYLPNRSTPALESNQNLGGGLATLSFVPLPSYVHYDL